VSKIVAGTNVTISPTGGTGDVTINSSTTQVNTSLESSESARNIIIGTSAVPPAIAGVFENTIYFQREA
jgi:dihydroxyacetone kinase DhaKLM complex PTS-EIIA-like component DhaM